MDQSDSTGTAGRAVSGLREGLAAAGEAFVDGTAEGAVVDGEDGEDGEDGGVALGTVVVARCDGSGATLGTGCTVALPEGDGLEDDGFEGDGEGDPLGVVPAPGDVGAGSGVLDPVAGGALGEGRGGVGSSRQGACTSPVPYAAPRPPSTTAPLSTTAAPARRTRRGTAEGADVAATWARRVTNASSTTGSGISARRVRLTSSRVRRFLMSLSYPHGSGSLRSAHHRSARPVVVGSG